MTNSKTGTIILNVSSALGLALLLLLATGSAKNSASGSSDADNSSSSSSDTEPKVSVCGKTLPNYEYIRGTCVNTKQGQCDEYYGLIPKFAGDMCKDEGGQYQTTTPTHVPCPRANLIGTCHYMQTAYGEPGQFVSYYSNNAESAAQLKKECNESSTSKTEWVDPPPPAASASAAPAHQAAKPPAAKPATSAKPAPAASKK
jgi:hypothetical protein